MPWPDAAPVAAIPAAAAQAARSRRMAGTVLRRRSAGPEARRGDGRCSGRRNRRRGGASGARPGGAAPAASCRTSVSRTAMPLLQPVEPVVGAHERVLISRPPPPAAGAAHSGLARNLQREHAGEGHDGAGEVERPVVPEALEDHRRQQRRDHPGQPGEGLRHAHRRPQLARVRIARHQRRRRREQQRGADRDEGDDGREGPEAPGNRIQQKSRREKQGTGPHGPALAQAVHDRPQEDAPHHQREHADVGEDRPDRLLGQAELAPAGTATAPRSSPRTRPCRCRRSRSAARPGWSGAARPARRDARSASGAAPSRRCPGRDSGSHLQAKATFTRQSAAATSPAPPAQSEGERADRRAEDDARGRGRGKPAQGARARSLGSTVSAT